MPEEDAAFPTLLFERDGDASWTVGAGAGLITGDAAAEVAVVGFGFGCCWGETTGDGATAAIAVEDAELGDAWAGADFFVSLTGLAVVEAGVGAAAAAVAAAAVPGAFFRSFPADCLDGWSLDAAAAAAGCCVGGASVCPFLRNSVTYSLRSPLENDIRLVQRMSPLQSGVGHGTCDRFTAADPVVAPMFVFS